MDKRAEARMIIVILVFFILCGVFLYSLSGMETAINIGLASNPNPSTKLIILGFPVFIGIILILWLVENLKNG